MSGRRRRRGRRRDRCYGPGAALGALAVAALLSGCGSSSPTSGAQSNRAACVASPAQCPAGTTCWPADSMPTLLCLPSEPGNGFGAACQQRIGTATCADGLACDQTSATDGACTYYCGPGGRACPAGYDCRATSVGTAPNAPTIAICRPSPLSAEDGGAQGFDDGSALIDVGVLLYDAAARDTGPNQQ